MEYFSLQILFFKLSELMCKQNTLFILISFNYMFLEQKRLFQIQGARLMSKVAELPIKKAQLLSIINQKNKIDPKLLQFDPDCQLLMTEMLSLNYRAIASLFINIAQELMRDILKFDENNPPSLGVLSNISKLFSQKNEVVFMLTELANRQLYLEGCNIYSFYCVVIQAIYYELHILYTMQPDAKACKDHTEILHNKFTEKYQKVKGKSMESDQLKLLQNISNLEVSYPQEIDEDDVVNDFWQQLNQKKVQAMPNTNKINKKQTQIYIPKKALKLKNFDEIAKVHEKQLQKFHHNNDIKPLLNNIVHKNKLTEKQIKEIQQIGLLSKSRLTATAKVMLNSVQIQQIRILIKTYAQEWELKERKKGDKVTLVQNNIKFRKIYTQKIDDQLKSLPPCIAKSTNYLYLVAVLYESLKKFYTPPAKRFLMEILEIIQIDHLKSIGPYLRGALRNFQARDIIPSELGLCLMETKPQRSISFQTSFQSCLKRHNTNFISFTTTIKKVKQAIRIIHQRLKYPTSPPLFQFVKLNYTQGRKTITILISGFLSQKQKKDINWQNMIHVLGQSELYALAWESSSIPKVISFCMNKLMGSKEASPFTIAFDKAKIVGIYLAQFLVDNFSDRFINLVGFSLGTRVIYCCLEHLRKLRKSDIINRIVTLGGVADKHEFQSQLQSTNYPLDWLNLWSRRDMTVRFLFGLWNDTICPIGGERVGEIRGHTVRCLDMTANVSGHLNYEKKLYAIGKMSHIYHD